jgi:hypothetical protein
MVRTIVLGLLAALAFAPAALAAPPTLVTVTQVGGKTNATWTLPTGGQVWTVEVAKATTVDSDGYFLADNVVDTEVFVDQRTSWASEQVLDPGTYYVHLSGWDKNCANCAIPEWSAVRAFTVPAAGSTSGSSSPSTGSSSGTTSSSSSSSPTSSSSTPSSTSAAPAPTASVTPVASDGYATISSVTAKRKGSVAKVVFRVCGSGTVDVTVLAQRGTASHAAVVTLPLTGGCTSYALGLTLPTGKAAASVSVRSGGGSPTVKPLS